MRIIPVVVLVVVVVVVTIMILLFICSIQIRVDGYYDTYKNYKTRYHPWMARMMIRMPYHSNIFLQHRHLYYDKYDSRIWHVKSFVVKFRVSSKPWWKERVRLLSCHGCPLPTTTTTVIRIRVLRRII